MVMRIKDMITQDTMIWYFNNFSLLLLKETYRDSRWEFEFWYLRLRWLDWIFFGGYFPSLSINYVAMSKDMEKKSPQLYYVKMKISFDLGFIAIGVAMAT